MEIHGEYTTSGGIYLYASENNDITTGAMASAEVDFINSFNVNCTQSKIDSGFYSSTSGWYSLEMDFHVTGEFYDIDGINYISYAIDENFTLNTGKVDWAII